MRLLPGLRMVVAGTGFLRVSRAAPLSKCLSGGIALALVGLVLPSHAVAQSPSVADPRECVLPQEQIAWSIVNRMRYTYSPLNDYARQVTVNERRQRDPNGGFIIADGNLYFLKPLDEWTRSDLRHVPEHDLQPLMILAAGRRYRTLGEITPSSFSSPQAFGAAILDEWERARRLSVNSRYRPNYIGEGPDGQPRFCIDGFESSRPF